MKIKVSEATNLQLDWMVASIVGEVIDDDQTIHTGEFYWDDDGLQWEIEFEPTINWAQGGPIIERERIGLREPSDATRSDGTTVLKIDYWHARITGEDCVHIQAGTHPLIAAMRCFVTARLGNEVEVPDELT